MARWKLQCLVVLILASAVWTHPGYGGAPRGTYTRPVGFADYWARVAERVPDFGGAFVGPEGRIHVYLADPDPAREAAIVHALVSIFGEEMFTNDTREVTLLQGEYTVADLLHMKAKLDYLLDSEDVLYLDLDETKNRLVVAVEDQEAAQMVPLHLNVHGVPVEAVHIQIISRPVGFGLHPEEHLLQDLISSWQQKMQSARLHDLPGVGTVAYIWHDWVVPFRIELTRPSLVPVLAHELRALGIPLSAVLLYERE